MCLNVKYNLGDIGNRVILIADAHQNEFHNPLPAFLDFLEQEIQEKRDFTLLLIGDIFDMLFGGVYSSIYPHENLIKRLEKIAHKRPVYYFEGNHDFNLKYIFTSVCVIERHKQPANATINGEAIIVGHGDVGVGWLYECYTFIIRNSFLLHFLGYIDMICNGILFKCVRHYLQKHKISYFKHQAFEFAKKRLSLYSHLEEKWIFEGHFHLKHGVLHENEKNYIGLPPFYCIKDAFIVESNGNAFLIYSIRGE